jgi:hypothetical protein
MRRRIKDVMRYAGPRMLYRHPILAMLHLCGKQRGDKRKIGSDRWDNRDYRYFNGE